jgi:hypothetical protein
MGTGSLPEVKRLGRSVDHPHLSNDEVKEKIKLYLYCPSTFMVCSRVIFTSHLPYRCYIQTAAASASTPYSLTVAVMLEQAAW